MTRRLFVPASRIQAGRAHLGTGDLHYLRDVLRLAPGTPLEIFDGEGGRYEAAMPHAGEEVLLGPRGESPGPAARVWLAFALARGERTDLVVQKATELGAERLLPFQASRGVVRLEGRRAEERARRWRRIAEEAARQCGRSDVPRVEPPGSLAAVLGQAPARFRRVVFHEGGGDALPDALDAGAEGHLALVGPEGGLAREEVEACLAAGARLATLGPRILRFETAAIAAVALIQHLLGDLGSRARGDRI